MTGTLNPPRFPHGDSGHDAGRPGSPGPVGWRGVLGRPETGPARWVLAVAAFGAVMGASLSLGNVLFDSGWMPRAFLVTGLTVLLPALVRRYPRLSAFAPIAALAGWVMGLTLAFFPATAYVGLIPSLGTAKAAVDLASEAAATVMVSNTPVPVDEGITFVICAGLGFAALLVDTLAITVALPATSAFGLILILLPAALTTQGGIGTAGFVGAAAGYLLVLGCCRWYAPEGRLRPATNRAASGTLARAAALGAAVVLSMALLPAAIPGFSVGSFPQGTRLGQGGGTAGLDPMISLGNDLRAQSGAVALKYLTSAPNALYIRLSTLEDFSGRTWKPSAVPDGLSENLTGLVPAFGPNPAVPETTTTTWMTIADLASTWLPAPLRATKIEALRGRWSWNPATETISGDGSSTIDKAYVVTSAMPNLTPALLEAASQKPDGNLGPVFTRLPNNVPAIVKNTAQDVTKGKSTPYDKAMAIQDYLRSGAFTYSTKTPVERGYDGAGMDVLAKFLEVKAGYCVHFSAAMAVMAREVGIPSRIAVGYAPGTPIDSVGVTNGGTLKGYDATGLDAHAWPELYFEGLGWVPFEPTPSRGAVPSYAQDLTAPGQNNNNDFLNGRSPGSTATATAAPSSSAAATATAGAAVAETAKPARISASFVAVLLVLLALSSPAFTRVLVRRRRLALVLGAGSGRGARADVGRADPRDGPEMLAWREFMATAVDYGYSLDASLTPSQQAAGVARLAGLAGPDGTGSAGSFGAGSGAGNGAASGTHPFQAAAVFAPASAPVPGRTPSDLVCAAYELAVYGPPATVAGAGRDDLADAVETIRARLRDRAGTWARIRAVLLPPSLFKGTR